MTKSNNKQLREQERNSLQSTCMCKSGFFCHNYFLTVYFFFTDVGISNFLSHIRCFCRSYRLYRGRSALMLLIVLYRKHYRGFAQMYQKHKLQNIENYTFVTFYFPVTTGVILTISFYIA